MIRKVLHADKMFRCEFKVPDHGLYAPGIDVLQNVNIAGRYNLAFLQLHFKCRHHYLVLLRSPLPATYMYDCDQMNSPKFKNFFVGEWGVEKELVLVELKLSMELGRAKR